MLRDVLTQLVWIFPLYSLLGWCLEVIYCSVTTGKFVNRGFLNGCICPIYGLGAGVMIVCLTFVEHNLLLLFLAAIFLGSLIEFISGFLLKHLFHITWWDYSDEPFNLGGYICLKYSLTWGVLGILLIHIVHPLFSSLILMIPAALLTALLVLFYLYFVVDVTVTVLTILKLSRDLQEITRLSALIHKSSDVIADGIGTSAIAAARRIEESELAGKAREARTRMRTAVGDTRVKIGAKLEDFERLSALLHNTDGIRLRLFKAFPNMKASRNSGALREMRQYIKNHVQRKKGR